MTRPFFGRHHIPTPATAAETATTETAAMTPTDRLDALTGALERVIDLSAGVVYHHHPEDDPGNCLYGEADSGWLELDPEADETFDVVHATALANEHAVEALAQLRHLQHLQRQTAPAEG